MMAIPITACRFADQGAQRLIRLDSKMKVRPLENAAARLCSRGHRDDCRSEAARNYQRDRRAAARRLFVRHSATRTGAATCGRTALQHQAGVGAARRRQSAAAPHRVPTKAPQRARWQHRWLNLELDRDMGLARGGASRHPIIQRSLQRYPESHSPIADRPHGSD